MSAPASLKYTKTHEWVKIEGDTITVGITDHAQSELGDITYLELPEAGEDLSQAKPLGIVESVKAATDIYSPVDGEVVERNDEVIDTPELVNSSPYEKAWLLKIRLSDAGQVDELMDASAYETFAESDSH